MENSQSNNSVPLHKPEDETLFIGLTRMPKPPIFTSHRWLRFIRNFLTFIFLMGALGGMLGCADEPVVQPSPHMNPKVTRRVTHEPGSLWTEDSPWNNLYSLANARYIGDTLNLKISDRMRTEILEKADREAAEEYQKKKSENPKAANVAAKKDSKEEKMEETKEIPVTIREVLPRGVFIITATQPVVVGSHQTFVRLEGEIKEKDIALDDSVPSDAIFNLNVNAKKEREGAQKVDEKAPPQKEEEKAKPEAAKESKESAEVGAPESARAEKVALEGEKK